ncbi:hypothetical protein [Streptomyces sp. NPDC090112]|uniref:hypothetical protein n=1 Tax=Streptomyces sp. NPDC090112 TaxID=3365949 RepID=UPI0038061D69
MGTALGLRELFKDCTVADLCVRHRPLSTVVNKVGRSGREWRCSFGETDFCTDLSIFDRGEELADAPREGAEMEQKSVSVAQIREEKTLRHVRFFAIWATAATKNLVTFRPESCSASKVVDVLLGAESLGIGLLLLASATIL